MKKYSIELCQEIAVKMGGSCLSTKYINSKTNMLWECGEKHQWNTTFGSVYNLKTWCKICYENNNRHNLKFCQEIASKKDGYCLSTEYKNNTTRMLWECGADIPHIFDMTLSQIANYDGWCIMCSSIAPKTLKFCQDLAISRGGKCLSEEYKNCKIHININLKYSDMKFYIC